MIMRAVRVVIGLLLLTAAFHSSAENAGDDVRAWLQRMVNAVHSLNYEGTFVYLHNNRLESLKIIHTAEAGDERERLISLNGVAREVFRDSASVTCIAPDIKSVSIGKRASSQGMRAIFTVNMAELSDVYDFHLLGEERVANRSARIVAIVPKDTYRYGYRIYIDKQHSLPLKTDMMDASGTALSQLMFTQIQVHSNPQEIAEIKLDGKEHYRWEQQKPTQTLKTSDESPWSFEELPEGFQVTLHSKRKIGKDGASIDHFVLSDGLASLSVYIEQAVEVGLVGAATMGTVNAFGSERDGYQVTAVGEVPATTVKQIATSLGAR